MQRGGRWLLALAFAIAACQAAPPPPRPAVKDPGTLAAEALERGDYPKAADLYRGALAAEPGSLPLHYGLGVAASYLDRKAEAVSEFTWVLERGEGDSIEVRAARRWLRSVGALPHPATPAATTEREKPRDQDQKPATTSVATATVHGRVMFNETPGSVAPMQRMQVFLIEHPSRVGYHRLRTDEQGYFRFQKVQPGIYTLTERVAGQPTWRLRVELKPGQDFALDLTPANSTRVRDDFPDPTQVVGSRSP